MHDILHVEILIITAKKHSIKSRPAAAPGSAGWRAPQRVGPGARTSAAARMAASSSATRSTTIWCVSCLRCARRAFSRAAASSSSRSSASRSAIVSRSACAAPAWHHHQLRVSWLHVRCMCCY